MKHQPPISHAQGSLSAYSKGFALSLIFTLIAYFLVTESLLSGWLLTALLVILALTQMWVQMHFFLHLGEEAKAQWNLLAYLFMLLVVAILVLGTLWIMNNLNERMMSPKMQMRESP